MDTKPLSWTLGGPEGQRLVCFVCALSLSPDSTSPLHITDSYILFFYIKELKKKKKFRINKI